MIRLEEFVHQRVLDGGGLPRRLAEMDQAVRVARTSDSAAGLEMDAEGVSRSGHVLGDGAHAVRVHAAEFLLCCFALVDAVRGVGVGVEVVGSPFDEEGVVFAARVGFLVQGDGFVEGSLADVAPL